ncbi:MAG TPA: 4Fe-4S dicluster domain-containing protein [Bacteroidales bacterium]|nr:4Fe-4S dicluster domain-containing protein [Bacteroidales bacterium]
MTSPILRKVRIVFSVIVLILLTLVFIDFRELIPESFKSALVFLQFTPSVLNFINLPCLATSGFIFVLVLTVFTGRSYCSFLCPLGILQDVSSRIGGKFNRRNRKYNFGKPYTIIRYSILSITLIVMLAGSIFLITLLDPYSIFGRLSTYFGKPVVLLFNDGIAFVLSKLNIYTTIIYKVDIKGFSAILYLIPLLFLGLVGFMSFKKGRFYCNTVCPAGTFLGLLSKISVLQIKIDTNSCTRCGRCSVVCKSSCIDFLNEEVDLSRCITCFNCLESCKDKAISFAFTGSRSKPVDDEIIDKSKRKFVTGFLAITASLTGIVRSQELKTPVPKLESTVPEEKTQPVCPPGGISIQHFNDFCTACSLCISACPTQVLQPSFREYGLAGIMQPRMDYHRNFCNFECTLCIDICPTGALMPLVLEAKKLTQLGKAKFIKDNCIVQTEKTDCGACSEHCPTKAAKMVPFEANLVIPEVEDKICIGCGACEYACPTKPFKAIYVDGNSVHQDAEKPPEEDAGVKKLEEFPF